MNHWEFYSFLVNNAEIDNDNIKKYFQPNFISSTDSFFKKYQDYISQEHTFEEIKKLRKHIGHEIKVVNH
jgi:urocanate hydratase